MTLNLSEKQLGSIIEKMPNAKVLVIGDIMLDRFIYGEVDRISPESPVPVLAIKREDQMLGGAGNALANLVGLETGANIIAVIGDDEQGTAIKTQIEKLGFSGEGLFIDTNRPTTVKSRFLAGHQQLLRTDFEHKNPLSEELAEQLVKKTKAALKSVGALIISDYGKGLLCPETLIRIIEAAREQNVPVIVDPKGRDFSIYRGATALTPNKKELSEATRGAPVSTDEDIMAAATTLIEECGIEAVVATRSGDGMSVIRAGAEPVHLRTTDIEVFDVSGAGDTVIATIAAALAAGGTLEQAAALANLAGSVVVTKVGTASIRRTELAKALTSDHGDIMTRAGIEAQKHDRARKGDILGHSEAGWAEAAEHIRRWKARGLKVGFTNGCFDILHYGHVSYLNNARDHCDRLIVGLNKDTSVKALKGPERPVHDEDSRAAVLAALGSVDMVVLFGADQDGDDNTAIALLETLKPDIYFKGGDYTVDQIPESPTVQAYGGEVNVMPVYEGHSTTGSIAKMKNEAA
ncbi:MAG: D-glycero-beta-D-manno-heptose-7-phosphate kinase [Rhodospirillales bacterium]|nr:D-glycero-beta-D-manno-heptose-7-phosphate kinase [Rhodospirillales bacterium]